MVVSESGHVLQPSGVPGSILFLIGLCAFPCAQASSKTADPSWSAIGCPDLFCSGFAGNVGAHLVAHTGWLYAATVNEAGSQVWRYDGASWSAHGTPLGSANTFVPDATDYLGSLMLGTGNSAGCEVWEHDSIAGTYVRIDPTAPGPGGIGNPANEEISGMGVYKGRLYLGTSNGTTGAEVHSFDGVAGTWSQLLPGWTQALEANGFVEFQGKLHVGLSKDQGCEVWRYDGNGNTWGRVDPTAPGPGGFFSGGAQRDARAMVVHGNRLFVGTENDATGCQVWSFDGAFWTTVGSLLLARDEEVTSLLPFGGQLYATTEPFRGQSGGVWRFDGATWSRASRPGFGVPGTPVVSSLTEYLGRLHATTYNEWIGGSVWRQ